MLCPQKAMPSAPHRHGMLLPSWDHLMLVITSSKMPAVAVDRVLSASSASVCLLLLPLFSSVLSLVLLSWAFTLLQ